MSCCRPSQPGCRACCAAATPRPASGGDEFAVLVVGLDGEDRATLVAARVLDALSLPIALDSETVGVRASVGIAVARGGDDAETLLHDADAAMYVAKRSGGQGWTVAERTVESRASSPGSSSSSPGCPRPGCPGASSCTTSPASTCRPAGWSPSRRSCAGATPSWACSRPDAFVPLAERLGRMVPLGREVLSRALQQVAAWDAARRPRADRQRQPHR